MAEKSHYLYQFLPKDRPELMTDPDAWTEEDSNIADAHFAYLKQATADRIVILAGRSQDGVGPAIVIFEAQSEVEAREFMENDPFVRQGLFNASLHPFRAALVREP